MAQFQNHTNITNAAEQLHAVLTTSTICTHHAHRFLFLHQPRLRRWQQFVIDHYNLEKREQ